MSNTANKGYPLQTTGTNVGTWGTVLNNNIFSIIDNNIGGTLNINVAGSSNISLTSSQASYMTHNLTGALTGSINYIFPAAGGFYEINNQTSGAYTVTVTVVGGSGGIVVPQGGQKIIFIDASTPQVLSGAASSGANSDITSLSGLTTPLSPGQGGTGVANNSANTITFTGSYNFGVTLTGNTSVTFPTSGTLVNTGVTSLSSLTSASSLATVGTIGTGTWQGTVIGPTYGGTGENNGSYTISLGGNVSTVGALTTAGAFTTSGAHTLTLTTTANTNVTLPTSGTLITSSVTSLGSLTTIGTVTSGAVIMTALGVGSIIQAICTISAITVAAGATTAASNLQPKLFEAGGTLDGTGDSISGTWQALQTTVTTQNGSFPNQAQLGSWQRIA